jgi:NAD(P)-dependent dehydrogenase (short-subunit alcohol dehydrogenase family)
MYRHIGGQEEIPMAPRAEASKPSRHCLDGVVAVVTGGGKGVGRTISAELAREGADVAVLAARDLGSAETSAVEVRALGRRAIALAADVTSPDSIEDAMVKIEAEFGRVDLLVNNAGHTAYAPLESLAVADWDAVFAVNAKGTFLASVAAARRMIPRNRGAIVNIAGASAHRSFAGAGAYGPSKAAVVNLTTQMALEWAKYGIRVNGVSPGPIRDEDTGWEAREPLLAERVKRLPLKRAVSTRDVARAVVYLASSDARSITGQIIIVDAGGTATWYITE